ncbi:TolC family protein [Comamonas sp. JC664]|uniref:TolC family protein n=1 Tax=Comamonas sp. JC664 TaxID=2801917 RepID=UPI00174C6148|nr:TolC family protein [Comamonas sp. JC664]MBL0697354.1 TolC family protein [Comamonas sp. JC664]GHG67236.1 PTS cellobiose transporter subunit IIC [Comamonas sp. KCTC 72670]
MSSHRSWKRSATRAVLATGAAVWLGAGAAGASEQRYQSQLEAVARQAPRAQDAEPFAGAPVLERAELVRQVLARNPSLEAAREAWRASLERYPRETALEDPMLSYGVAPLSIAGSGRFGQSVELSQQFPFPGKRGLRGEMALAEAQSMREDREAMRLRLALMASTLFDELFVVERSLAVTEEHLRLLGQLKKSAEAQYVTGRASQQDPLQAEVELSEVLREQVMFEAERERLRAQLNGLLHRAPQAPLPPVPEALPALATEALSAEQLQDEALRLRPELEGLRARLGGGEAAVRLAKRDYYPDVMVMGSYNSMWMDTPHQFMAGVTVNIPLDFGKRKAAVHQAEAGLKRLRKEEEQLIDDIRVEVEQARSRAEETRRVVALFQERLAPAARDQVAAARAGFESGKNGFQVLIEAERNLRRVELREQTARADVQRRQAELDRALGHIPGLPRNGETR